VETKHFTNYLDKTENGVEEENWTTMGASTINLQR
jgi:hypothetical protein